MKKCFILFTMGLLVLLSACNKDDDPVNPDVDNTPNWVGTYTGEAGSTVNQIVVTRVNNTHLKMELKVAVSGSFYTFATIQNAEIKTATSLQVNEDGLIFGSADIHHFAGSGVRSGNNLTLTGSGTNKTNSADIKQYYFTGAK